MACVRNAPCLCNMFQESDEAEPDSGARGSSEAAKELHLQTDQSVVFTSFHEDAGGRGSH